MNTHTISEKPRQPTPTRGSRPFLGADCPMGPNPDTSITGNHGYTRAHFLYYSGVVASGRYR